MDQDAQLGAAITFCSSATGARVQGSNDILLLVSQSCAMRKKTTVRSSEGGEGNRALQRTVVGLSLALENCTAIAPNVVHCRWH